MNRCLFCNQHGPYTIPEHIIPEALGNDDLVLSGEVCDNCNHYFGNKVEAFVLEKSPLAFWRTFLGIKTKRGALPHVDLSNPKKQKGRLPALHPLHDNLVGFTCHDDYSISVDISDDKIIKEISGGERNQFTFVFTPLVLSMMGRFFCKVGAELLCLADASLARSDKFIKARFFARHGDYKDLWPFFHIHSGNSKSLREIRMDKDGLLENVLCYHYRLLEISNLYTLLALTVGTDTWIISLNDPYPTPIIQSGFPGQEMNLIWYNREEQSL